MLFARIVRISLFSFVLLSGSQAQLQQTAMALPDSDTTIIRTQGKAPFIIPSNGVLAETWYTVFGDLKHSIRVPLIVAHGGGATHHYLKPLSRLASDYSIPVILYDQIGTSLSSHFPEQAGNRSFWTLDLLLDELQNLIRHLGIENEYDFLGHSFGTVFGLEISSCPLRQLGLRRQVLYSPAASTYLLQESMKQRREKLPKDIRDTLNNNEAEGTTDSEDYQKAMEYSMHENFCRLKVWPKEIFESREASMKDPTQQLTLFGKNPFNITGTMQGWSAIESSKNISVPTLLLNGVYDWSDEATEPLFWNIPKAKWLTFSNSSHLLHFEEPERFMKVVGNWLTQD